MASETDPSGGALHIGVVKALTLLLALMLSGAFLLAVLHPSQGADPAGGTLSEASPSLTWQGETYVLAATSLPEECPPEVDPANLLCDHFFLDLDVAPDFWDQNTGQVSIRIEWASADNDFDLYVFGPDGTQVGSSAAGGTSFEEVALIAPLPGTYEVRVVPFLILNSDYQGAADLLFTPGPPTPNPTHPTGGIAFAPAVIVDPQRTEGEPLIYVDQDGNIWESGPWGASTAQSFIHKSVDDGDSYHIVSPIGIRSDAPPGGGDTDLVTDDQGFAYFVDLEGLLNLGVAVSNDGGNSWRKNAFAVASTIDDRQWFALDNGVGPGPEDNTVFLTFRQIPGGLQVFSSPGSTGPTDLVGGLVYQNAADTTFVAPDAVCGRTVFEPVHRNLYLVCRRGDHVEVVRGSVDPGQRTGIHFERLAAPPSPGGAVGDIFPSLTADVAGSLYAVWADANNHNVYLSASATQGATWTPVVQVNGDPANTNVWPWSVAGAEGIVDVVWFGTATRGDPDAFPSWYNSREAATTVAWFPYFAQVHFDFADPTNPTIFQVRALDHPNHFGQICQGGLGCLLQNGDRTMADFLSVAVDGEGAGRIVFDDTTNQHHGAAVFELRQIAGPGAFGSPVSGSAPTNPVTDPPGDAEFPHFSPTGPGPNQDPLDFLGLELRQVGTDTLRVRMVVRDASLLLPPPGAESSLWITRWQVLSPGDDGETSFRVFYVGARSVGGAPPTFFSGTGTSASNDGIMGNGCVTTTPRNCKILLYPEEKTQPGTLDPETGEIVIEVPLAHVGAQVGEVLFSVTALSFGEIAGDPFLQDVDATRAFDFPITEGVVQEVRRVTGGGFIHTDDTGSHGNFGLVGHTDGRGKVAFQDHATGLAFRSAFIAAVTIEGNRATIKGTGFVDGVFTNFVVTVEDVAEPGVDADTFSIQLETGYARSGTLKGGNVRIH